MDEVQAAFYRLRFRIAFLEKKGTEFQDWFARLANSVFGPDFETVGAYGNQGDLKCDGRRLSTRTIFQCYAPYQMRESRLIDKIREDFHGARDHWCHWMSEWIFVHNETRGLPPSISQQLDTLRDAYPDIAIAVWQEPELRALAKRLDLSDLEAIFGFAPSKTGIETLVMDDLKPVIDELQRMEPSPGEEPLTPPSVRKLERNALSADAAELLRVGRRKEARVAIYFRNHPRPDLGEQVAEAFRRRYARLKEQGRSPDEVFHHLQQYAGTDGPRRQGAALAVLSYFFERCDIFEDVSDEP